MATYCANDTPLFDPENISSNNVINALKDFQIWYSPIHGYICVAICLFGIVTNLVHVLVLTRPTMRSSAVNCILTAVAICDMGTMISYMIYITHFVLGRHWTCTPTYTFVWIQFLMWHVVLSIALHTTSLWLAVAMAFIRRMTLRVARLNSAWQRPINAWRICLVVYACVFALCIPTMLVHDIVEYPIRWQVPDGCDHRGYAINYSAPIFTIRVPEFAVDNGCRWFKLNLWMTGLLFKVIPCYLLFVLSIGLMLKLREAEHKRRILLTNKHAPSPLINRRKTSTTQTDRTTIMLILILAIFLVTELPQGGIAILNAICTSDVHTYIYSTLGDVLDLLSLINSSVNFLLYCAMSSRYRSTFWTVILPRRLYIYMFVRIPHSTNTGLTPQQRSRSDLMIPLNDGTRLSNRSATTNVVSKKLPISQNIVLQLHKRQSSHRPVAINDDNNHETIIMINNDQTNDNVYNNIDNRHNSFL